MRSSFPARGWTPRLQPAALLLIVLLAGSIRAEIIDRVVAVVGGQAITASDVERQIRLEAMLNREPLALTAERRKEALERLITLRLVQGEAVMGGFLKVSEEEAQRRVQQAKKETYLKGVDFEQALKDYALQERDVQEFWRQVIGFDRFKDFRFKTGRELSPEEVTAYYQQQIVPEFKNGDRGNPPPLAEIYSQVEQAAIEERANTLLDEWIKETRPQTRIVILDEQSGATDEKAPPAAAAPPEPGAATAGNNGG